MTTQERQFIMANSQNLYQNQNRTPRERQEAARKAGIASGQARREKQQIRAIAQEVLNGSFQLDNENLTGSEILTKKLIEVMSDTAHKDWYKVVELLVKLTSSDVSEAELNLKEAQAVSQMKETERVNQCRELFDGVLEQL